MGRHVRKPCRACSGEKPAGSGRIYCDNCDPVKKGRQPCRSCGGPKEPGHGRNICRKCANGTSIPPETRREVARLYQEEELSLKQAGERVFFSASAVRNALRAEGVELRKPATGCTPRSSVLKGDDIDRAAELYAGGLSHKQIAERLGLVSEASVRLRLKRAGMATRPRSDVSWIRRLSDIADNGAEALTRDQRATLAVVELAGRPVTTPEVAAAAGIESRAAKVVLRRLERMRLVKGRRMTTTKARPKEWVRTAVQFRDVLHLEIESRTVSDKRDVWLPIGPFRAWVTDLIARERRAMVREVAPRGPGSPMRYPAGGPVSTDDADRRGSTVVAGLLGMDQRRLYALMHEQEHIGLRVADAALLASGEPVRLEDLWPELEDGLPEATSIRAATAKPREIEPGVCAVCLEPGCDREHAECSPRAAA